MEILNNPRGTGKTTIIVNKAIKTGYSKKIRNTFLKV